MIKTMRTLAFAVHRSQSDLSDGFNFMGTHAILLRNNTDRL